MDHEFNYAAEEVQEMLNEKRYRELKAIFAAMEPADIAIIFEDIPDKLIPLVYRILPKDMAAEVFVEMDNDQQEMLIASDEAAAKTCGGDCGACKKHAG